MLRIKDIRFLLSPEAGFIEAQIINTQIKSIAKRSGVSLKTMCGVIGINSNRMRVIEKEHAKASSLGRLHTYFQIADFLGVSLLELLTGTIDYLPSCELADESFQECVTEACRFSRKEMELSHQARQIVILEQIPLVLQRLETNGVPITKVAVLKALGLNKSTMRQFPDVHARIAHLFRRLPFFLTDPNRLEVEIVRAEQYLVNHGRAITVTSIARQVHHALSDIRRYPSASRLLDDIVSRHKHEREQELLNRVHQAICEIHTVGGYVTVSSVGRAVGMSRHSKNLKRAIELLRKNDYNS